MGFPCTSYRMAEPIVMIVVLGMIRHIKLMFMVALSHLHLIIAQEQDYSVPHPASYVIAENLPSPSLVLVPTHTSTASIKKRLPVVIYRDFIERCGIEVDEDKSCAVCFYAVDDSHEIRELPKCLHVFHRECLDSWVDAGQVTCPLGRSLLFPAKRGKRRYRDPWRVERSEFLSGGSI
ncbi:hypothetical protein RJ639_043063 [Escallonia herrerae]|uniref:RING-type domain-containing protein n=1 Tax=Escallonia herrerae TaxID=1293975 RepID=A0AA88WDQ2_9ASTE|nr:hypothetical protein RJ639_043063 [Escallonia herrerae]